jgi:uncharacterized protein YjbI with pentapeptide repeats
LRSTQFNGTRLSAVSLRRAIVQDATLSLAEAWRVDFAEALVTNANLYCSSPNERLNLAESKWGRAQLFKVDLTGANLFAANFDGATLEEVNFSKADLRGAKFKDTTFKGVNLTGAIATGLTFTEAQKQGIRGLP